ncbi:MAG: hypothetical protein WC455_18880 [Dehalococcoidia bacterium]|jgi:hypothetical protein
MASRYKWWLITEAHRIMGRTYWALVVVPEPEVHWPSAKGAPCE